jgi:DNA-binding CsgD family transcriptional regulator/tetratricopeptide (TPR) repeat protein
VELLERDDLVASLQTLLDDAASGRGRLALVSGEAGAGKSALLRRFSDVVSARADILSGSCDPLSSPRPLGPLVDVAPQLGAGIADMLQAGDREHVFDATLAALRARKRPAVFVVEDVHWADVSTMDFLRFIGRRLGTAPVLLVVSYRDDQLGATDPLRLVLGDLASSSSVFRVCVPPLSLEAVAKLAEGTGIDAAELHAQSAGNAFFVSEVVAAGGGLPSSVSDAVQARVGRMSAAARHALEAAAVVGVRIEPSVILRLRGVRSDAVDECVSMGMLAFDPPTFVFRHDLARQAVLDGIAPGRLADLHADVLAALRAQPDHLRHLARLADHAEHAGDADAAVEFASAAGDSAAALKAHREAAFQYGRALRFLPASADADVRLDLLTKRSFECFVSDLVDQAIESTREAIRILSDLGRSRSEGGQWTLLTRFLWTNGRRADADDAMQRALQILEQLPPGPELAMAYARKTGLEMLAGRMAGTVDWGQRAIALAEETGATAALVGALNSVGSALMQAGDVSGEEMLLRSLEMSLEAGLEDDAARAYTNLAATAQCNLEIDKAIRYSLEGMSYCADHDLYSSRLCLHSSYMELLMYKGDWASAIKESTELLVHHEWSRTTKILYGVVVARIRARLGEPDWPLLDECLENAIPTQEVQFLGTVAAARAEARWLNGDADLVRDEVAKAYELALETDDLRLRSELGFWMWRAGELDRLPDDAVGPYALHVAGDLRSAADAWRDLGIPYDAAVALADSDDEQDLRAAIVEFDRLGAKPMLARTTQRLRALGFGQVPRGARASTRDNPAGLTTRELDVLRLLEEGLRNAEIAERLCLSEKTVGHHVSAVLAKLNVASRGEAARKARDLLPAPQ